MTTPNASPALLSIISFLVGGGTLILVRHGNTGKAADDASRELTPRGVAQAAATRNHIERNYDVSMIVSSSARRAVATVSGIGFTTPATIHLPELYVSPEGTEEAAVVDEAFRRLAYVPLAIYLREPPVEAALGQWAERAALALEAVFVKKGVGTRGVIVVGGHAILSNSLALTIARAVDPDANVSFIAETSLGEAECLEMSVRDGTVRVRHLDAATLGHPAMA